MENFWKEYTIFLPAKKEYIYDIQNKNTNCVIIRNFNITNISAGINPHAYEVTINPNRTGFLTRPFPLNYVYLLAYKPTPVSVTETTIQNPINNFIQQKITKNIITRNTPQICEEAAYNQLSVTRIARCPPVRRSRLLTQYINVTLDCGIYGRPLINIVIASCGMPTWFSIGFSNDNINYFFPYTNLQGPGGRFCNGNFFESHFYPPKFIRNHINLINAFRFVRLIFKFFRFTRRGHFVYVHISGIRCHTKNRRQLVTRADGF